MLLYELVKRVGIELVDVFSNPLFFLMAILILAIYKREAYKMQDEKYVKQVSKAAMKDIFRGVILGVGTSSILYILGVNLQLDEGMILLVPIAFIFMFIHPKLGCFSYVVPSVYLVHTLLPIESKLAPFLDFPYEILFILIGILHLIEGVLVFLYGDENSVAMPVYHQGKIMRAHFLKKFWIVPFMGFYAILCYQDQAIHLMADQKKRRMGFFLMFYAGSILFLSWCILQEYITLGIGMLLMPFLHESTFLCNDIKPLSYKSKALIK